MQDEQTTERVDENGSVRTQTVTKSKRKASGKVVAARTLYYIGGLISTLLALRIVFQLLGANTDNAFIALLYGVTDILVWPFNGIFGEPTYGRAHLDSSAVVALIIYAIFIPGIGKLLTLGDREV